MAQPKASLITGIEKASYRFLLFAKNECHGSSPVYEYLSLQIANDTEILTLVLQSNHHQPLPNILFGAVHYLLLQNVNHPLANFYPTIKNPVVKEISAHTYSLFRNFCFEYKSAISALIANRIVHTNEVLRSACLFPGFSYIDSLINHNPLAVIEIGASAGLNLYWDKYCYDYGINIRYGALASPVILHSVFKNNNIPYLATTLPSIDFRLGINLHPLNIKNPDEVCWLKALIWPEHLDRFARLTKVVDLLHHDPPQILAGDAVQMLPEVFVKIPTNLSVIIFHSFMFYQLSTVFSKPRKI